MTGQWPEGCGLPLRGDEVLYAAPRQNQTTAPAASPPLMETTHYILRVTDTPSSSAVTDSLDFRDAVASLQIQFASAKCVLCAFRGKHVIGFLGRFAPLRIQFLCPPEREILTTLCFEILMKPKAERRANFPLRGGKGTGFVGEHSDLRIQ